MFSQCDCGFWQWKDFANCAGAATSSQGAPETSPALGNHGPVDGYPSQYAARANGFDAPADFRAEVDRLRREYLELEGNIYRAFVCWFTLALVIVWFASRV